MQHANDGTRNYIEYIIEGRLLNYIKETWYDDYDSSTKMRKVGNIDVIQTNQLY